MLGGNPVDLRREVFDALDERGNHFQLAFTGDLVEHPFDVRGLDFEIMPTHVDEVYPQGLTPIGIAIFLAELKAGSFDTSRLHENSIVIAADTLVCIDNEILGKPGNYFEAVSMLEKLSGSKHTVITAVRWQ